MAAVSNSLAITRHSPSQLSVGASSPAEQHLGSFGSVKVSFPSLRHTKSRSRTLVVQATYSDGDRPNNAGLFIGGFVLGGLVAGTLGCIYAPQISKVLAGADRKDLMRKLPKFIYDEEKALERTRKILTEKIAQLNSAIDDVSSQLRSDSAPTNGVAVSSSDEVEATM